MASCLLFCYCIVCIFIASCALLLHHVHGYCVACMVIVSCAFLLHCVHCYCIMCIVIALCALLLHHVQGYCVACIVIALCALLLHHVHFYCIVCIVIASRALLLPNGCCIVFVRWLQFPSAVSLSSTVCMYVPLWITRRITGLYHQSATPVLAYSKAGGPKRPCSMATSRLVA